jgi:hypothetical protein
MRTASSILVGVIASIAAFSVFWSQFVIRPHTFGEGSRLSQLGVTLIYFLIYIAPVLVAAVLLLVLPIELELIRKRPARDRRGLRRLTWGVVAAFALAIPVGYISPEYRIAAAICGLGAAAIGAFAFERIASAEEEDESA